MTIVLYMHTLDGKPAYYDSEYKMVFFLGNLQRPKDDTLVTSLNKIRRQQNTSRRTRLNLHIDDNNDTFKYGYARLTISEQSR
jgi:hypothetical protein